MSWADNYIQALKFGHTVKFRPRGNSMTGRIESGQLVIVEPIKSPPLPGDVVLCKVNGHQYLHLVKAVRDDRFQIGNNKGKINGWIGMPQIYGLLVKVCHDE